MLSVLELMEIHVNVLFRHDVSGRMTDVNESSVDRTHPWGIPPRLFIGGTKGGNVVRYLNTLSKEVVKELEQSIETESDVNLAKIIHILSQEQSISNVGIGPVYLFPDVKNRITKAIQITQSNKNLLLPNFPVTFDQFEYRQPCFAIVHDNMIVSLCFSSRQTSRAAEAGLFTLEGFRGRSYSVDVANAWAAEVQSQGRIALYGTSWNNFSSQAVAKKLQLIQYGTEIYFG